MARTGNLRRLIADEFPDAEPDESTPVDGPALEAQLKSVLEQTKRVPPEIVASVDDSPLLYPPIDTDFESKRIQVPEKVPVPAPRRVVVSRAPDDLAETTQGIQDRLQALVDPSSQPATADAGQVRPGSMKGFFQQAVTGTGAPSRKPLVSPEVAAFVAKQTGSDAPDADAEALAAAKRRAGTNDTLASLTDQLAIANGAYNAGRSARLHQNAQQPVADEQAKQDAVRAFVEKKLGLERQARQDQRQAEIDDLNRRNIESEISIRERGKQPAPVDPLDAEKKRAEIARIQAETDKLKGRGGAGGGKAKPGAQVPAGEAAQVGQYDAALKMLDNLESERNSETGAFSGVMQYLPGTEATKYSDATKQAAQTIGTILEGGKLTDADLPKYMAMLPSAGDGEDRAAAKIRRIRDAIKQTRAAKIQGLTAAGFNTSGFGEQGASSATAQPSSDDGAAVAWAKANPNDPRAKRILELNMVR